MKNPDRQGRPGAFSLRGATGAQGDDPLREMAKWMTARTIRSSPVQQANRIWFHLMGRGLVNPIDDFRPTNPATPGVA